MAPTVTGHSAESPRSYCSESSTLRARPCFLARHAFTCLPFGDIGYRGNPLACSAAGAHRRYARSAAHWQRSGARQRLVFAFTITSGWRRFRELMPCTSFIVAPCLLALRWPTSSISRVSRLACSRPRARNHFSLCVLARVSLAAGERGGRPGARELVLAALLRFSPVPRSTSTAAAA